MSESELVGIFTLGGALLGGVIGVLGTYFLENVRRKMEGKAAVRLLRTEVTTNTVVSDELLKLTTFQPFENSMWEATRFQLALFLDATLLADVTQTYFMFPYYQTIMQRSNETQYLTPDDASVIARWKSDLEDISKRMLAIAN